ncbi:Nudix family hydrolase [Thiomicrorhabdus cannonii]|uniref:Nudix family hydrolase n=1 Tax=Thiomicrorhabdus cannonii TaxID=2748011 RepID=UPI0015B802F5|nr:Nudix family hydrolase [Thiomicrorhabdus cannonii]
MQQETINWIDVAIGVLRKQDKICLTQRQAHQHLADFWEFPGGKIEAGESVEAALEREFKEEIGVQTAAWKPVMVVPWRYEKVAVRLHVYETAQFEGEAHGKEGQALLWCAVDDLAKVNFPEANRGIVQALLLPDIYMSVGDFIDHEDALARFEKALQDGVRLAQLKAKGMDDAAFETLANDMAELAHLHGAKLLLNAEPAWLERVPLAAGIQLSSKQAGAYARRPISDDKLLAVSVHDLSQAQAALQLQADFLTLSPIKATAAHPDLQALGWDGMAEMITQLPVPVYALGGMKMSDKEEAKAHGAQGVALTKGAWPESV